MSENQVLRDPAEKQEECWRVVFNNRFTSPSFQSKGAAQVYLSLLEAGRRKPEYSRG